MPAATKGHGRPEITTAQTIEFIQERAKLSSAIRADGRTCRNWVEFEQTYMLADKYGVLSADDRREFYKNAPEAFAESRVDNARWSYGTGIRNQLLEEYVLGVRMRAKNLSPEEFQAVCDERISRIEARGRALDETEREFRATMRGDYADPYAERDVMAEFEAGIGRLTAALGRAPLVGLGPHEPQILAEREPAEDRRTAESREMEHSL